MVNTAYALLAERADARDRTELLLSPHVKEEDQQAMAHSREELDAILLAPMGRQAEAEQALLRALGG